ncbi:hypothetical protein SALBM311S_11094 [Streptomyces alboniger]
MAITGPSGAGKSTLLHLLGGLQRPDSGSIWLDGERSDTWSEARWAVERRKRIGIVFQFFNLVSDLSVADNVELPALLAGASPKQARAEREALLAELGLTGKERACPASCPAVNSSGSRSPGPWSTTRRCCWPTSPRAAWTARAPAR